MNRKSIRSNRQVVSRNQKKSLVLSPNYNQNNNEYLIKQNSKQGLKNKLVSKAEKLRSPETKLRSPPSILDCS